LHTFPIKYNRVATGQEMVREKKKFFKVREKSGNFILSQGKLKNFNMADLMPLKAGRNIWSHHELNDTFPYEEEIFVANVLV